MKKVMGNKRVVAIVAVMVLTVALLASGIMATPQVSALAPPPSVESKINYQGQLTDSVGNPLDGTYDMEFLFYDAASGGSQVGSTITKNNVPVNNGLFNVKLDVDQTDFDGQGLWLEIKVEGEILSPRQEILPVPYALSLRPGSTISGASTDAAIEAENTGGGDGLWGIATGYDAYGVFGQSGFGSGVRGEGETGVYGESTGGGIGVYGEGSPGVKGMSDTSTGVYGVSTASTGRGVYGIAPMYGVYGEANATSGTAQGVYGKSASDSGKGVYGYASAPSGSTFGVYGNSASTSGTGVSGYATATNGSTHGVYGRSDSPDGYGVYGNSSGYGVYGISFSTEGKGVYGRAPTCGVSGLASDTIGYTYGVYGESDSSSGTGVTGEAAANSGNNFGVRGLTHSSGGTGVYGWADASTSGSNGRPYGVHGYSNSGHGVYGQTLGDWGWVSGVYGKACMDHANGVTGWNSAAGPGVYAWSESGTGIVAKSGGSIFKGYDISPSEDLRFQVTNNGEVYADGNFHSGGADFAEMLAANEGLEPGDVLVIGPDGKLARSSEPYASNVVGVYSTNPGFVGGDSDDKDMAGKVPLAIVGVVPVKASAENGSIAPGDLLTSASKPGYAMKATDLKVGTILGKALELLDEGTGVILMLVMLQ